MNFISRLINHDPPSVKALATLGNGEFSIVRSKDSPRGRRELILKEAQLNLVSTTREFFVQIQVRDSSKEDETTSGENDESLDSEGEDENDFLVHEDLKSGYYLSDGRIVITWKDLDGEEGTMFEFLCSPSVPEKAFEKFDHEANLALYGQKYGKKPPSNAPSSLFDEFRNDYSENERIYHVEHIDSRETSPLASSDNPDVKKEESSADSDIKQEESEEKGQPLHQGIITAKENCDSCVYDSARDAFKPVLVDAEVVVSDQIGYEYFLEVHKNGRAFLGTYVDDDSNQYVDLSSKSSIFNYSSEADDGTVLVMSYLSKFINTSSSSSFERQSSIAQYEARHRRRFVMVQEIHQQYLIDALTNVNFNDDNRRETDTDSTTSESSEQDDSESFEEVDSEDDSEFASGEKNSALEVGRVNDRTYVSRGNKIGVFKNDSRDSKYTTTISNIAVNPKRIMSHEKDRTLIIQGEDPKKLHRMDLETGKIVDGWRTSVNIVDFNPIAKFSQTTDESNLYAVSDQAMFRIDPRLEKGSLIDKTQQKQYRKFLSMSHIVTTDSGFVATGSTTGDIRSYDRVGRKAVTLFPGLGNPIIGLDVTANGHYVSATCARYLLLIETITESNNGYTGTWFKHFRPTPKKLQILPENMMFMRQQSGSQLKFTPARFNAGPGVAEETIVTSMGPYLITWSSRKVSRGERDSYKIKKYTSDITSEDFKYGTDKRVISTSANDVNMVAKSALKSPDAVLKSHQ